MASSLADAGHRVAVTGFLGRENVTLFERLFARKRISDYFVRLEERRALGSRLQILCSRRRPISIFQGLSHSPAI